MWIQEHVNRWREHPTRVFTIYAILTSLGTLAISVDLSLADFAPNNPYSPLWFMLNPFYQTQIPYRIFLFLFQGISFGGLLYAYRHWNLPGKIVFAQITAQLISIELHWHENITVTAFAWTAYYWWLLAMLAIQKLPVGWSLDLRDAHWECLRRCFTYADGSHAQNAVLGLFNRDAAHDLIYATLVAITFYPVVVRWLEKKAKARAETLISLDDLPE